MLQERLHQFHHVGPMQVGGVGANHGDTAGGLSQSIHDRVVQSGDPVAICRVGIRAVFQQKYREGLVPAGAGHQ